MCVFACVCVYVRLCLCVFVSVCVSRFRASLTSSNRLGRFKSQYDCVFWYGNSCLSICCVLVALGNSLLDLKLRLVELSELLRWFYKPIGQLLLLSEV